MTQVGDLSERMVDRMADRMSDKMADEWRMDVRWMADKKIHFDRYFY